MKLFRICPTVNEQTEPPCWVKARDERRAREQFEKGWEEVPPYTVSEVTSLEQLLADCPKEFMVTDGAEY